MNVNSSITMSNTEQGSKYTHKLTMIEYGIRRISEVIRVNSCYLGLIMIISFILHTPTRPQKLIIVLIPVVVELFHYSDPGRNFHELYYIFFETPSAFI